jgi:hypothetical protein
VTIDDTRLDAIQPFLQSQKYVTPSAPYVAAQNHGVHHAMPSTRKSETGHRNRVA